MCLILSLLCCLEIHFSMCFILLLSVFLLSYFVPECPHCKTVHGWCWGHTVNSCRVSKTLAWYDICVWYLKYEEILHLYLCQIKEMELLWLSSFIRDYSFYLPVNIYNIGSAVNSVPAIGVLVYYLLTLTVTLLSESSQSKTHGYLTNCQQFGF